MSIKTERLEIRHPAAGDGERLYAFDAENAEHFGRWASSVGSDYVSAEDWEEQVVGWFAEHEQKRSRRYLFFSKEDPEGAVIGVCNFSQIFFGAFQACYMGYRVDSDYEGKGLMYEGIKAVMEDVFAELGLHRIMANYVPSNERSGRLLERLGFEKEGLAKEYLKINGKWEDHVLAAYVRGG